MSNICFKEIWYVYLLQHNMFASTPSSQVNARFQLCHVVYFNLKQYTPVLMHMQHYEGTFFVNKGQLLKLHQLKKA